MKKIGTMMSALTIMLILSTSLIAQSVGDYQTRASGNWSMAQNWQRYNGSAWANIGTPPTGSETITVLSTDSVFVNVAVSITGKLVNQGIVEPNTNLSIANGGTYQHDRDGGRVPLATWEDGSTMLVTGVTGVAPNDRDQDYYNLAFNTPGLLSNLHMNLNNNTIRGDIRVIDSGPARWYLTSTSADSTRIVTIMGDVIVEGGAFSSQGTGNARTTFIVHQYGNVVVTGGNFSVARGSQGSGTGSTRWYLHEGNFSMSNATTQNSNTANAWFVFDKAGVQTLELSSVTYAGGGLPIEVADGTTLDFGVSELGGNGLFSLNAGATLATAHPGGIAGAVQSTGNLTFDAGANYIFNGTTAQITSALMPTTVNDLTIDNQAGVVLSQPTTINGVLHLKVGVFDNMIPFTLGPNGMISYEGGSLKVTVAVKSRERNVPESFFIEQNYPNPLRVSVNPSTTIRFGLPGASHVTVKVFNVLGEEVATLFDGRKEAGVYDLRLDAANLSAGVYLYRVQAGEVVSIKRMVLMK
jgi:Secretion system C-terminal sorting domain